MRRGVLQYYYTKSGEVPPTCGVPFAAVDEGNASPKLMRPTLGYVPSNSSHLKACGLPLGVIVQPMADVGEGEEELPLGSVE